MNFVLTGHKGLIGSALLKRLEARGDTAIDLIDIRGDSPVDIRNLKHWHIYSPVDVLYHLASFCKINQSIKCLPKTFEHNVRGTYEVMNFCRRNNIPKIVFTSSTRVLYPEKNPYTASKVYGEEIVKAYEMEYVIIRPSTVYGPHWDETGRLVHIWVTAALRGEELKIYGDENKTLDFTYIDDFVDAFLKCSETTNAEYNIGTGREIKLVDVAEHIIKVVGKGTIGFYPPEKLQPQNVVIDTDVPCNTDVFTGLDKTIEFYRSRV